MITLSELKALLWYDPVVGLFINVGRRRNVVVGTVAGCVKRDGYRYVTVKGRRYFAHRLAHFYMTGLWPEHEIDHRNMIRSDNRWANLRSATRRENKRNTRKKADNTTGFKGVSFRKDRGTYRATINGRHVGTFSTAEAAFAAYRKAAARENGEFARST